MFVGVGYWDDVRSGYKAAAYIYNTALDLRVGDEIIAPTKKNPAQRGIVTCINQPQPSFPVKEITEYYTKEVVADE